MMKSLAAKVDRWTVALLVIAALGVAGLSWSANRPQPERAAAVTEPGVAEDIQGSDVKRVILTEAASQRLGLKTEKVTAATSAGKQLKAMPYGALFYEPSGDTWAYTQVEPLVFVRQHLTVDHMDGDKVLMSEGPAVGTDVVTIGSAELAGVEYGVGEE